MMLELAKGRTIPDIIRHAREHPIHPAVTPNFDQYLTTFAGEHALLFMLSFSVMDQRWEYHFSLSRKHAKAEPGVAITLGLLCGFMAVLGIPDKFAMSDNVVHLYWPREEAPADGEAPARH
jgi:hypothetical protein